MDYSIGKENFCKGALCLQERDTDDLQQKLLEASDLDRFMEENNDSFVSEDMAELLLKMLQKKKMTKSMLARGANISEIYLHQVFAGQRRLSRNRLLCVCFGLGATLEETQALLGRCGFARLYARSRRDAVVMFGLTHNMTLFEVNDKLLSEGEKPLF